MKNTKKKWRFLPIMTQSAPEGVALDEVLLDCKNERISPNTIRFYHFNPPAVICGYHQATEDEVNVEKAKEFGYDLTRRITGGGTLFVAPGQIGIAMVLGNEIVPRKSSDAIRWFSKAIINGLNRLEINAVFRPKNDIAVNGRKIVGTGQAVRGQAVLFHAIVLIDFDVNMMRNLLRIPDEKFIGKTPKHKQSLGWCFNPKVGLEDRFTTITRELKENINIELIYASLKTGFEETFDVSLVKQSLLPEEVKKHSNYIKRYKNDDWVFLRKIGYGNMKSYMEKTKAGMFRIIVATEKKTIKSILISGDFFVFPSEAIFDLEALLKWTSTDSKIIRNKVTNFFIERNIEIPWLSSEELADIIIRAINSK